MYLRTATRKNKNGSTVRYLQLAHNEWDPVGQVSRRVVLFNFGREDQVDKTAIARLIASLSAVLSPEQASTSGQASGPASGTDGPAEFTGSRPFGGTHLLDGLWHRLGIHKIITGLVTDPRARARTERILFALVANRALKPSSKLAAAHWVSHDVAIEGLDQVDEDACYRAMDPLLGMEPALAEAVYWATADLLNLEVDLLFFDTTSTYFQIEAPDEPVARDQHGHRLPTDPPTGPPGVSLEGSNPNDSNESTDPTGDPTGGAGQVGQVRGFRSFGKSKDHRDDLPQVVIGMAVTRTGIPIRVWSWPGATTDTALIRQVKDDLKQWTLARVVWVADRGFTSAENRRYLQRAGGHYILGEKLRSGSPEATAALSRQGRYRTITDNMRVKEVNLPEADDRFVICHNPDQATRDAAIRGEILTQLGDAIAASDALSATKRAELRGRLSTKPGLNRFLRVTPGGLLRIDKAAIKTEQNLDGKYLLRSSDPKLSAEDIAIGYKQLLEVERGWRDMKQIIDLRPVHHRLEDRIRAHVLLCWLALLLIRITETTTGNTWNNLRRDLERLHLGTFTGPAGTFTQTTTITATQHAIYTAMDLPTPPRFHDLTPRT